jgi:hypothetical protein
VIDHNWISDSFYSLHKTINYIDEIVADDDKYYLKIKKFQIELRKFNLGFYYIFRKYFKTYRRRLPTYKTIVGNLFYIFDKLLHISRFNVEIKSQNTNELLLDFKKYLLDIEDKILIPVLENNLLIHNAIYFFNKWDNYFKNNYKSKYKYSGKYFEEHKKVISAKYRNKQEFRNIIVQGLLFLITDVIIIIITLFFTSGLIPLKP